MHPKQRDYKKIYFLIKNKLSFKFLKFTRALHENNNAFHIVHFEDDQALEQPIYNQIGKQHNGNYILQVFYHQLIVSYCHDHDT